MQIVTRHNKVIDYCSEGYISMNGMAVCPAKNKTFCDADIIDVDSLPTDINRYEYYFINGEFVKEDVNLQNLFCDTISVDKTTTFNPDGSITETSVEGYSKVTVFNADGSIAESTYYCDELVRSKLTVFNADGSISETVVEG